MSKETLPILSPLTRGCGGNTGDPGDAEGPEEPALSSPLTFLLLLLLQRTQRPAYNWYCSPLPQALLVKLPSSEKTKIKIMCLKCLRPFCDVACFKMAWQQKRDELLVSSCTSHRRRCLKLFPGSVACQELAGLRQKITRSDYHSYHLPRAGSCYLLANAKISKRCSTDLFPKDSE